MYNKRASLVQKCISDGFSLTPIEVIHLKCLSEKESSDEWITDELILNPYLGTDAQIGTIPNFQLEILDRRAKAEFPKLYKSANYAYKNFWHQNITLIGECYKGIALITQFRYMCSQYLEQSLSGDSYSQKEIKKNILLLIDSFTNYSYVHEKKVSVIEVVESLRLTFTKLLIGITNVLILNFYLTEIIDIDEIILFKFFELLYKKEHGLRLYFDKKIIDSIVEENHEKYLESISHTLFNIPNGFSENSLQYVKNTIYERINLSS